MEEFQNNTKVLSPWPVPGQEQMSIKAGSYYQRHSTTLATGGSSYQEDKGQSALSLTPPPPRKIGPVGGTWGESSPPAVASRGQQHFLAWRVEAVPSQRGGVSGLLEGSAKSQCIVNSRSGQMPSGARIGVKLYSQSISRECCTLTAAWPAPRIQFCIIRFPP